MELNDVTGFRAASSTADSVTFTWTPDEKADGYIIEQLIGGEWVCKAELSGGNNSTYTVNGLNEATNYSFRIQSFAVFGDTTVKSNCMQISASTKPSAVANLKVLGTASTAIRFGWDKNIKAEGYVVEQYINGAWSKIYKGNALEYKVTGLKPDSQYEFRVKAYATINGKVVSSEWTVLSAKTNR